VTELSAARHLPTAYALAEGVRALKNAPHHLRRGVVDGATGQVPRESRNGWDLPQVTGATTLQVLPKSRLVRARRELRGGYEIVECAAPLCRLHQAREQRAAVIDFARWDLGAGRCPRDRLVRR